ncbi:hypothetical protein GGF38_004932, partial [Coemansia sp. RSA 25]
MLLQGNAVAQDTSLLDNILSQFETTQQFHTLNHTVQSAADTEYTRVGAAMDEDDETRDVTMHASLPEQADTDSFALFGERSTPPFGNADVDDEDDENGEEIDGHEDAVTMDLTGIFARPPPQPVQQADSIEPASESSTAFLSALGPILQSPRQYAPRSSQAPSGSVAESAAYQLPIEEQMPELQPELDPAPAPSFKLDTLPVVPFTANPPMPMPSSGSPTLADHARAALVFGIFDVYRQQEL